MSTNVDDGIGQIPAGFIPGWQPGRNENSYLTRQEYRRNDLIEIIQGGDTAALTLFAEVRWGSRDQQACPKCGLVESHHWCPSVRRWKCKATLCGHQFTVFSGTRLHGMRINPVRILAILKQFMETKDSISAREISGLYDLDHKTAHVLLLKTREAILDRMLAEPKLRGKVQADAAYFFRYVRPGNVGTGAALSAKRDQKNAGLTEDGKLPTGTKDRLHALVVFVEDAIPRRYKLAVVKSETQNAINELVGPFVDSGAQVTTDAHGAYGGLPVFVESHRTVNHSAEFVSIDGYHVNFAESLFARIRQAHAGAWHRMSLKWLELYAAQMTWRQVMVGRDNEQQLRDLISHLLTTGRAEWLRDYWRTGPEDRQPPRVTEPGTLTMVPRHLVPNKMGRPKKGERRIKVPPAPSNPLDARETPQE